MGSVRRCITGQLLKSTLKTRCVYENKLSYLPIARQYSSAPFDINSISRSNQENKSLDGVKKSVTVKVKKSKPVDTVSKESTKTQKKDIEEIISLDIPDYFGTIFESPMYSDVEINNDKHVQFKDFVEELDIKSLPSVSKIIKDTEPKAQKAVLLRWKKEKTKELGGEKQFEEYRQATLNKGLNLHKCIQLQLTGHTDFNVATGNQGHWVSVQDVLKDVSDVKLIEENCVHPEMFYRGKFDCIAQYRDTLCLIEWKTSSKPKPLLSNTYDNPLQVAAYIGAVNRSGQLNKHGIPKLTKGAIVIAYPGGEPATVHRMTQKVCEKYWNQWINRLYQYWTMLYFTTKKEQ